MMNEAITKIVTTSPPNDTSATYRIHSLNLREGLLTEFKKNPNLREIRSLSEAGQAGMKTPDFGHFAPLVQKLVDMDMGLIDLG